jgi:peptidyl-prolyl cis-trans isomerase D
MLQTIRDRSKGLIVGIIVGLISLTFVLVGVQSYLGGGTKVTVAKVAGGEIYLGDFQRSLQRFRQRAQATLGESFNPLDWDKPEIKQKVIDELIDNRLVDTLVSENWLRVSDDQVASELQAISAFHDDNGSFSRQIYSQRTRLLGYTEQTFEQRLRNEITRSQLYAGIAASQFMSKAESDELLKLIHQRRDLGYVIIPGSAYASDARSTDDTIRDFYKANEESYRVVEKVNLAYVQISPESLAISIQPTDQELQSHYEQELVNYTVAEERDAEYILFPLARDALNSDVTATYLKVDALKSRISEGEDFSQISDQIAAGEVEDANAGETGFFARGVMASEFENSVFGLEKGQVSEPIRTDYGVQLIRLRSITPGGQKSYEEALEEVTSSYVALEGQKLFFEKAEDFSNFVYEYPEDFSTVADSMSLEIMSTGLLSREALTILFSEEAMTAAFDPQVIEQGLNSAPIELPDGRLVSFRLVKHEPSFIRPYNDVKAMVQGDLLSERMAEIVREKGENLVSRIENGEDAKTLLKAEGFDWKEVKSADRNSSEVNRAVLEAGFGAVLSSGLAYVGVPVGKSDFAVIKISNLVLPELSEIDLEERNRLELRLLSQRVTDEWRNYLRDLREKYSVTTFQDRL